MGAQNDIAVMLQNVSRVEMKWRKYRESGGTVSAQSRQQVLARWRSDWRRITTNYPAIENELDDMVGSLLWVGNMTDYKPDEFAGNLRRALANTLAQGRSVGVIKTDAKKSAALASQIETRVNAWRHRAPGKGDAIKSIDGWIRDAGIAGDEAAVAVLRLAVAEAERIGTVKAAQSWDGVIAGVDEAVKSLRGVVKAEIDDPDYVTMYLSTASALQRDIGKLRFERATANDIPALAKAGRWANDLAQKVRGDSQLAGFAAEAAAKIDDVIAALRRGDTNGAELPMSGAMRAADQLKDGLERKLTVLKRRAVVNRNSRRR